jgi:hypothetical protein
MLNPFSTEEKAAIQNALEKGVNFYNWDKDKILDTLAETIPELKNHVEQAINKAENEQAVLKEQILKKIDMKTNKESSDLLNRVHVARARI